MDNRESPFDPGISEAYRKLYPVTPGIVAANFRGSEFKNTLSEIQERGVEIEQGVIMSYTEKGKIEYVWIEDVGRDFGNVNYEILEKKKMIPFVTLHIHPLSEYRDDYLDYVPSDTGISNPLTNWWVEEGNIDLNTAGGLIIPGKEARVWLWQGITINPSTITRIYRDWSKTRKSRRIFLNENMNSLFQNLYLIKFKRL